MKTNSTSQINQNSVSIKQLFLAIIFLGLMSNTGKSQTKESGLGIAGTSYLTGSGLGIQYSPTLFFTLGRSHMEFGPVIQKRKLNMTGFRTNYEFTVFDGAKSLAREYGNERLELFFFADAIYNKEACLGIAQVKLENQVKEKRSTVQFEDLTYRTVEAYGGFGLRIKLTNKLKWSNSIGMGGWHTFSGENRTDREYNSSGLMLRTSLSYQF